MANETASVPTSLTTNAFTRTGYQFAGWNTVADAAARLRRRRQLPLHLEHHPLRQWSTATSYTVTFNANLGTGTMANETASVPTNLTTNAFTRTGYHFAGWNTAANGSGTAYADGAATLHFEHHPLRPMEHGAIALVAGSTSSTKVGTTGAITVTSAQNVASSSNVLLALMQVFGPNSSGVGTISDTKTGTWTALGETTVAATLSSSSGSAPTPRPASSTRSPGHRAPPTAGAVSSS